MKNKHTISVIILNGGKSETVLLKKCLASVSWADEIIKVDTKKIKGSFAEWRNWGAKQAKSEWVFYVDTDEEVSSELKDTVLQVASTDEFSAYAIPRQNIFLGQEMKYGGWYPDYVLRLIKKDKLKGWSGDLHEQPIISGQVAHLKTPLKHTSHRSITEMVDKTNNWSEIEAKLLYDSGHPKMNILRFLSAGFREFWHRAVVKVGFLDGVVGVIELFIKSLADLSLIQNCGKCNSKMKAAIHNPYLDTLGGGERYTVSFAKVLTDEGWDVDLEWRDLEIKDVLIKRFGIDLSKINIVSDIKRGDGYDLCFWVSDGSIPALRSRKNILHFQVPFHGVNGTSLMNKMKLFRVNEVVCNSEFTKKVIDEEYGVESKVIYPPIDTESFKSKRKENIILYVGRFSKLKQSKHQEVLIETFIKLCESGLKDWKLVLAGGSEVGSDGFTRELKSLISNYPIQILESPDFKTLKNLYGIAKIFWSAAGYSEDEIVNPEKMEHFGMSVVEAMASRCVPVVYGKGGHTEIISDGKDGYLWKVQEDLVAITNKLVSAPVLLRKIATTAEVS